MINKIEKIFTKDSKKKDIKLS